jgi:hypothetical protein
VSQFSLPFANPGHALGRFLVPGRRIWAELPTRRRGICFVVTLPIGNDGDPSRPEETVWKNDRSSSLTTTS